MNLSLLKIMASSLKKPLAGHRHKPVAVATPDSPGPKRIQYRRGVRLVEVPRGIARSLAAGR